MTVIPATTPAAHQRRERLARRLALRGLLLLAIAELLALALRGTEFLASG
jgi:hypothetical protein